MITRSGDCIAYTGCTEVTPGLFISDEGEVYIHDEEGEVCCWVHDELAEDPEAATAALTAVALAAKRGAAAVRRNLTDKGNTLGELIRSTELRESKSFK